MKALGFAVGLLSISIPACSLISRSVVVQTWHFISSPFQNEYLGMAVLLPYALG
jgi:hypothetical protein